jgi:hypothetical protein
MKIAERTATWRRERRVLLRPRGRRGAWNRPSGERAWALASARAEGVSIRTLRPRRGSPLPGCTRSRPLRTWTSWMLPWASCGPRAGPPLEDPSGDDDAELDGRDLICDRLADEAGWIRRCAGWLTHLHTSEYPPAVNLRPDGDHPDRALVVADLPRVAAILQRIAADELARARRVADPGVAAALPARRAERRRRVAEPGLDFREFCRRSKLPQSERSWDLFAAERLPARRNRRPVL